MSKKLLVNIILVVILLASAGGLAYYRGKQSKDCSKILEKYAENHACILTSKGVMVFSLYNDAAPKSISHLKKLGNEDKFYDNLEFYRLVKDFVLQGGIQDMTLKTVGVENYDSKIKAKVALTEQKIETESNFSKLGFLETELKQLETEKFISTKDLNTRPFSYGSLSFANAGPGTNSTELFIVTGKDAGAANIKYLNGRFTNMGTIVEGQSILDTLNGLATDDPQSSSPKPLDRIEILELRVK
jgi:cyclophilin family peptidyl-prolyl cis-trans isomerase